MKSFFGLGLLIAAALLLQACSDSANSPEDEIRQFIEAGVQAGENRSVGDLSELIHPDYGDQNGYNRRQLGKLLQAYFFRHKSIHLFTRIDEIELLTDNEASVRLHVAMAGTVISDVNALSSLSARIYRFELQLFKQGEWLLRHASWAAASIADLQ
ncbi:MAG: hypothetical protein GY875_04900 [Gammaproteobacteria bacterium]|nr:hypothetical protein [Gammaproteobacteria bacterium]